MTQAQWIALNPVGTVTGVNVSAAKGQPVVNFKLTDASGNGLVGLENYTKLNPVTDLTASYPNFTFTIAKLIPAVASTITPGAFAAQSKWVNYIVVTTPNVKTPTAVPTGPTTDGNGTLVGHGDGTYTYTFATDITKVASTVTSYGTANKVDVSALDPTDLVFDPQAPTRVVIEFFGNARGAGSGSHANTPTGSAGNGTAEIKNPLNIVYDFIPATGATVAPSATSREIVTLSTCNNCHAQLAYHGGHRVDPKNCVTCHTDQRRYGSTEATRNGTTFTSSVATVNGTAEFDFDQLIHQIHMGSNLLMAGHDITPDNTAAASTASGVAGEYAISFPQNVKNCTACHVSNAATPQAGNWATTPSRAACGGCHDGVSFVTGQGTTLSGNTTGHVGGPQADDKLCAICHTAPSIAIYHVNSSPFATPVSPFANAAFVVDYNSANMPAGTINVAYDVKSLTLNSASNPVLTFRFLTNGGVAGAAPTTPVAFNAAPVTAPSAADITANNVVELMPNFVGSPDIFVTMAVPQDGIATPADFNTDVHTAALVRMSVRNCWNKVSPATTCTMTGPDSSGYYALTVTGTTIPTTAVMVTGGLGMTEGYGTSASPLNQTNVSGYPVTVLKDGTGKVTGWQGGINVAAPTKTVTLSGALPAGFPTSATNPNQQIFATTARRAIVEKARCESCHGSLGNFTSKTFHGGQFNDPTTCAVCHDPNLFDSGWQIASGAWVHEIHSSAKRAADIPLGGALFNIGVGPTWATLEYPGLLTDCLQCHLPGTVNFGNAANATQAGLMTYRTALSGAYTVGPFTAPFGNITSKDYGARFAYNPATGATTDAAGTTLVNSPITNACFSCHTTTVAQNHMLENGGVLYATRASVTVNGKAVPTEGCLACHGAGRLVDAEAVHLKAVQ